MSAATKILIVEHNPSDIELLHYELKNGGITYISEIVENEMDYCHSIKKFMPDIILSDYRLPQFDGPSAFRLKGKLAPDTPFIFVSGTIGEQNSIEYIKNGLTDYVLKDTLFTLTSKVKRALKEAKDNQHKKKIDQELIQSAGRLAKAQQLAGMGSWELELTTKALFLSNEACRIFGQPPGECVLSHNEWFALVHPDDIDGVMQLIKTSEETHQDTAHHYRIILQDKTVRHIYSESKYESDTNGGVTNLYGIIQDVTQLKIAESERTKMISDLIQRNQNLEQFAYIVSHNLRAPVANILGAAKSLDHPSLNAEKKEILVHSISDSIIKLDVVLKDLNTILQLQRDISELKELVHFSVIVEKIKASFADLESSKAVKIDYDFAEVDEMITLESYMYSIFYNLISNSIKYRQKNLPAIINITSSKTKQKIGLSFVDNGMGIDLKLREGQVFGLYKRFHAHIEGKGMGLFMVKTRVETLGGKIWVKSEVNKGTEFKIEFDK